VGGLGCASGRSGVRGVYFFREKEAEKYTNHAFCIFFGGIFLKKIYTPKAAVSDTPFFTPF
jgi:hypothetical protein